ncbi:DUF4097 family beta strand repeat protein [Streptomyces sp. MUM 203J]|uniref:DUF4097 family beta strand repeat-containing protein n=1 Tax=Streptomyces sp. MUM 203J TaxID=2791990 RepID=UPI001F033BBA|nr:DUF4097 family beta strand repeat-containing protein [Streptomyces sp. MUM 203J]MCH0538251.1 DUF4097 family beta strand repeat protein [Streptomyces sp. MUM 203J]
MTQWTVNEPVKLTFDDPLGALRVRVVNGAVNVIGTEDDGTPARLEVSALHGPPLLVTLEDRTLTVTYEDLTWAGLKGWLKRGARNRSAVVTVTVPAGTDVQVGTVAATATVSGLRGRTEVQGVSGDTTLARLSGPVRAETVSGALEAQAVTGDLRFRSVSGDLTVVDGSGAAVRADSVSGDLAVDVEPAGGPTDIQVTSVSGEVAIRLPHRADAHVEANTTSGSVSNAFEGLRVGGMWGAKQITGTLGAGTGTLKATTVSGAIALLRRPEDADAPAAASTDAASGKAL